MVLCKLRSKGVGGQFLSILKSSLAIEGSACVWMVRSVVESSGLPQSSVLMQLLIYILHL